MEKPDGTGSQEITSIKPATGTSESTFEGPIEGCGRVYVAQTWTALDTAKDKGTVEGEVRVLLPDGTMHSSPLRGTFRPEGKKVLLYFTDAVYNGDMNFVAWCLDLLEKKASVKYFSIQERNTFLPNRKISQIINRIDETSSQRET